MTDVETWPPLLVFVQLKSGETEEVSIPSKGDLEIALAEIIADPEVHNWVVYEQIKSSYPSPSVSDDRR